jgi:large repetitive protein
MDWTFTHGPVFGSRSRSLLLAGVVALAVLALLPARALAVGPAFDGATPTVFVVHGTPLAQLSKAVESNGQLVFEDIGPATVEYNSIAYDTVDNYIYGLDFSTSPTRGDILQVGSDGIPSDTGINLGTTPGVIAAWNPTNDEVYFVSGPAGSEELRPFDPATSTLGTPIPVSADLPPDLTYSQGFFWGWFDGLMYRVDPATGAVSTFPGTSSLFPGCFGAPTCGGAGADWTYGNGNLGFNENQGEIYQISVTNPASASPTFKLISQQPGPASGNIDGAANPGLPTDLSLTKTASPTVPGDGGALTYTLTVTNHGPGNSSGYTISDTLPSSLSNPATTSTGCSISGQVLTCVSANPLNAGATSAPVTVTGNVPNPFTTPITNTATVTANEQDPNPTNNSDGVTTTPQADLQMTKTASPSPVVPGTNETYTLTVKNNGPDTAESVSVSDPLPSEASFSSSSSGCTESSGTVHCSATSVAPGASKTFTITVHLDSSLAHCPRNTATVTSSTSDPDTTNNTSTVCPPFKQKANIQVQKLASSAAVTAGGQVMYTLVVNNNGPSDATGVIVSDAVPAGLTLASAQPSQGSCSLSSATCNLGNIADGGSAQVLVTANVASTASGSITNCATATGDQQDPNAGNNHACTTIPVTPAPEPRSDISIDKRVNHRNAAPGQKLTYTLVVTNHGPDTAPNVKITDTASLSLKVVSAKPSQGSCHKGRPTTCSLGTLANGAHATVKIVAEVMDTGTEKNTASSTCACIDPNPHNNLDSAKTKIAAKLSLRKTASPRSVTTGHTVTFFLKVTNPNPVAVKQVKVCDQMPRGLSFVSSNPAAFRSHGQWCWKLGTIRKHRSRTVSIRGEAGLSTSGPVTNHATVSAPGARTAHAHATVNVVNTANACGSAADVGAAHASRRQPVARIAC